MFETITYLSTRKIHFSGGVGPCEGIHLTVYIKDEGKIGYRIQYDSPSTATINLEEREFSLINARFGLFIHVNEYDDLVYTIYQNDHPVQVIEL